jgi:hypothetical protein
MIGEGEEHLAGFGRQRQGVDNSFLLIQRSGFENRAAEPVPLRTVGF